jgi:hypothetical protein
MATRKHDLKADSQGRFRPRIGWELVFENGQLTSKKRQPRFNLGTDRKEAEGRHTKIQELYDDNCKVNGEDVFRRRTSTAA